MKTQLTFLSAVLAALLAVGFARSALAQGTVPERISLSARMTDTAGAPVAGSHDVEFGLFDIDVGGAALWTESRAGLAFSTDGLFSLELGAFTPLTTSVLDGRRLYLQLTVDGTAMSPRIPIVSVPYALRATTAASASRVGALAPADLQRRVAASCSVGEAIRVVNDDGSVSCQSTGGTYSAGAGISIAGTTISADLSTLQSRVSGVCAAGSAIRAVASDGTVTCEPDDAPTYGAAPDGGLTLGAGNQLSVDGTVALKASAAGNQTFDTGTLHLDYANNRVGVNTTAPAQALDVSGTVQATNYLYRTARAESVAVAAVTFVAPNSTQVRYTENGFVYATSTATVELYGSVPLPQGATTITGVVCSVWDNSAANDLTTSHVVLVRASLASGGQLLVEGDGPTSGASTTMRTFSLPTTHTIDHSNHYFIKYSMQASPGADSSVSFYGCRVNYTSAGPG